jgi:peroxiredoxin
MALTPSTMLPLGIPAPDFSLPDTNGTTIHRSDFAGRPLLVIFLCNHCPYVKHIRGHLAATCKEYQQRGVAMVGINANDATNHPEDSPDKMVTEVRTAGYTFPYLYDQTQVVAKAYQAACTPDFFLFDREHRLVYRGQYDDSRPDNGLPVTGADLRGALDAVLAGQPLPAEQKPSIGCNIKWKPGNEPAYLGGGVPAGPAVPSIEARLHDVARLLRDSSSLDPESRRTLAELVDELGKALRSAPVPPAEVARLAERTTHLAESLHHRHDRERVQTMRDRFEQAVVNAEVRHPLIAGLARRLLDTLANIGI